MADPGTLLKLADALDDLARVDPDLAEIIELKFFCGLSFEEIAAMRDVSARTIQRAWDKGRLYLHRALCESFDEGSTRSRAPRLTVTRRAQGSSVGD